MRLVAAGSATTFSMASSGDILPQLVLYCLQKFQISLSKPRQPVQSWPTPEAVKSFISTSQSHSVYVVNVDGAQEQGRLFNITGIEEHFDKSRHFFK